MLLVFRKWLLFNVFSKTLPLEQGSRVIGRWGIPNCYCRDRTVLNINELIDYP
jgi:hypothetical protein